MAIKKNRRLCAFNVLVFCYSLLFSVHPLCANDIVLDDVNSVISEYRPILMCTHADNCWDVAHYLEAYGEDSYVLANGIQINIIKYLFNNNSPANFIETDNGGLVPLTAVIPTKQKQDHPNQFMAILAQSLQRKQNKAKCPLEIDGILWHKLLLGTLSDYRLSEDPSWTLICYSYYFDQLPVSREEVVNRIKMILELLVSQDTNIQLACSGTHSLYSMAFYLHSSCASFLPIDLNERVKRLLNLKLQSFYDDLQVYTEMLDRTAYLKIQKLQLIVSHYGHTLEWIVEYLPESELKRNMQVQKSFKKLCAILDSLKSFQLEKRGGICHAIHALRTFAEKTKN